MWRIRATVILGSLLAANHAVAAGLLPVPTLTGVELRADAREDPVNGWIVYSYAVTNPPGNTGEIWRLKIDVLDPANEIPFASAGLTVPRGTSRVDFFDLMSRLSPLAQISPSPVQTHNIVPFGQNAPAGWNGGLGLDGFASFHSGDDIPKIVPGSSLAGFELLSYGLPSIREAQVIPFWVYVVEDHSDAPDEEVLQAGEIERSLPRSVQTLGPSGVAAGSEGHWNKLRDDLAKAIQLGWIVDPQLASALTAQLAAAREAFEANDSGMVNTRVQQLIDMISASTPQQRNAEAHALVLLNARRLLDSVPAGFEPTITLAPKGAELNVGEKHVITVTLLNRADDNRPLVDERVVVRVDRGSSIGAVVIDARTDDQGMATLEYVGEAIGIDKLVAEARFFGGEGIVRDAGEVVWTGGADLTVPFFSPPILITEAGRPFFVNEETQNVGNIPSPASVTRYYISPTEPVDPDTAQVVGERNVPELQPGGASRAPEQELAIPSGLPPGTYFLAACADANREVTELSEDNNCSFSELKGRQSIVVPMEQSENRPPIADAGPAKTVECSGHQGTAATLDGSASSDPDGDTLKFEWKDEKDNVVGAAAVVSVTVPLGTHPFTLTVTDPGGLRSTATTQVTVRDQTRPVIASVTAKPRELKPRNELVPVRLSVSVADGCDAKPSCKIISVTRKKDDDDDDRVQHDKLGGKDDDDDDRDWVITGDLTLKLRAKRGRAYVITVRCTDGSGNHVTKVVTVRVRRDEDD